MPTYKNMDVCLPFLKQKRAESKNPTERTAIQIAINIIQALPQEYVEEGVICRDCWFYDAANKKCCHNRGLMGRVLPKMYCSFGSKGATDNPEEPDPDFSEFDEEETE